MVLVAPPNEHIRLCKPLRAQTMIGLLQRGCLRCDRLIAIQGCGDRMMHPVGIKLSHCIIGLFVDILAPDDCPY
jgi:hypothetical protein